MSRVLFSTMAQGSGTPDNEDKYFVSKSRAIIFIVVVVLLAVVVGLAAGLSAGSAASHGNTQSTQPPVNDGKPWMTLRLPSNVVPDHYKLMLFPKVEGTTFTGRVSITVNITKTTKHILVHIRDLAITGRSVSTIGASPRSLPIVQYFEYKPNEFYVIEVGEDLMAGSQYNVTYDFSGNFPSVLYGLYKSTYKTPQGVTRYEIVAV